MATIAEKEYLRMRTMKNTNHYGRRIFLLAVSVMLISGGAAGPARASEAADTARDVINQVSLLQGLTFGDYYGSVPVSRLKEMGDTGIGTFDALNGELIMLDGVVYRAAHDGTIEVVDDEETIPFANVTFFDADAEMELKDIENVNMLKELQVGSV